MSKVMVTGGSGFIGGHVVERLHLMGHEVLSVDLEPPFMWDRSKAAKTVQVDVRDGYTLTRAIDSFGGVDAIIHLAGVLGTSYLLDREEIAVDTNIKGTLSILRIARDRDVKIVAPMVANSWYNPYTITKRAAGNFIQMFAQEYGVRFTLVKETHVYGPRQLIDYRHKVIPMLVGNAILGNPIPLFHGGRQGVDLVFVSDTAEALCRLALTDELNGEEIDFAHGDLIPLVEVAEQILELTGSTSELQLLGRRPGQTGMEDDHPQHLERIFEAVGEWDLVPLDIGLPRAVSWYQDHFTEVGGDYLMRDFVPA